MYNKMNNDNLLREKLEKQEQELYSLKRRLFKLDQKAKHEQYIVGDIQPSMNHTNSFK